MSRRSNQSQPSRKERTKSSAPAPSHQDAVFEEALAAQRAGQLDVAREKYRKILSAYPEHAAAQHLLGFAEFQAGDFAAAVVSLRAAVALRPQDPEFQNNLALASLAQGDLAAADRHATIAAQLGHQDGHGFLHVGWMYLEHRDWEAARLAFLLALRLEPATSEPHNFLGVLAAAQQQWEEAERYYRRALELCPTYVEALNNLGNALRDQGRTEEAVLCYQQALEYDPRFAAAHNNLGVALVKDGRPEEAIRCYQEALRWNPQYSEALSNLGNACLELGRVEDAVGFYGDAAALQPRSAEILCNLGAGLQRNGRTVEAIQVFREAVALRPDSLAMHHHLAAALTENGELEPARRCLLHIAHLKPEQPFWRLRAANLLPTIYDSREEIDDCLGRLRTALAEFPASYPEVSWREWEELVPPCPFGLQFLAGDVRELREAYANLFAPRLATAPFGRWVESWTGPREHPRLGFVVTDRHEGLFLRSLGGILRRLSQRWEVVVFCSRAGFDRVRWEIPRREVTVVPLPAAFDRIAQTIADGRCDLLYHWEVGTDSVNYFLPFLRLAPVQVTSWGRQITSGIRQVDAYLSSSWWETAQADRSYTERLLQMDSLPTLAHRLNPPEPLISREALGAPAGYHWYVCAQQLGKFHPDFDAWIAEILRQDPQGLFLATGDLHPPVVDKLKKRWDRTLADVRDRAIILPRLDAPRYASLVAHADVHLDPPYFHGANSSLDAFSLGQPVVTLPTDQQRGRTSYGCYRQMGVLDCVATDAADYVRIAVRLGTDAEFRLDVRRRLLAASTVLFEDSRAVTEHERLWSELLQLDS